MSFSEIIHKQYEKLAHDRKVINYLPNFHPFRYLDTEKISLHKNEEWLERYSVSFEMVFDYVERIEKNRRKYESYKQNYEIMIVLPAMIMISFFILVFMSVLAYIVFGLDNILCTLISLILLFLGGWLVYKQWNTDAPEKVLNNMFEYLFLATCHRNKRIERYIEDSVWYEYYHVTIPRLKSYGYVDSEDRYIGF